METIHWVCGEDSDCREDYTFRRMEVEGTACVEVNYRFCNPQYPPDPDGMETYVTAVGPILEALKKREKRVSIIVLEGKRAFSGGVGSFSKSSIAKGTTWGLLLPEDDNARVALITFLE